MMGWSMYKVHSGFNSNMNNNAIVMKRTLFTIICMLSLLAQKCLAQADPSSLAKDAMAELRGIMAVTKEEKPPYSVGFKSALEKSILEFEKKYRSKAKADKDLSDVLLQTRFIRLDTSLFSLGVSEKSAQTLVDLVDKGRLNADLLMMMGLVGRISTSNPTPVYSGRVRVLKALVDDYFAENEISTFESLEASGNGLLIYAYTANEQYKEAATYHKELLNYIENKGMNVQTHNLYEEQVRLEILAGDLELAISTMNSYIQSNKRLINEINIRIHTAKISSEVGNQAQAIAVLDPLNLAFNAEEIHEDGRYEVLSDISEAYFLAGEKDLSIIWLNKLIIFLQQNESHWRYTSMYFKTENLLDRLNQAELLAKLSKPKD